MQTKSFVGLMVGLIVLVGVYGEAGAMENGRVDNLSNAFLTGSPAQPVGTDVAMVPDMNGDGYDELAVGSSAGNRVYVLPGGPDGWGLNLRLAGNPSVITYTGDNVGDLAGYGVAGVGDVNGDGFGDLLVGAPFNDLAGNNAGAIYIVLGSASLTSTNLGMFPIMIGEVAGDEAGRLVSPAGDVNGDGFQDMLVGVPGQDAAGSNAGAVYLIRGSSSIGNASLGSMVKYTGEAAGDQAGTSADGIGDMNGDGYGDIVVGASGNDEGASQAGAAYVVLGGAVQASSSLNSHLQYTTAVAFNLVGSEASGAGDFNGDGYTDVAISGQGGTPGVFLLLGSATPTGGSLAGAVFYAGTHGVNVVGPLKYLAQAGDVNGDGYGDVLVGSETENSNAGAVYLLPGTPNPVNANLNTLTRLAGVAGSDFLGSAVKGNGDVNGDGLADVVIATLGNDEGGNNAGGAYVIFGDQLPSAYQEQQRLSPAGNVPALPFAVPDVQVDFTNGALAGGDVTVTRHLFHPCATDKRLQTPIWTVDTPKLGGGTTADLRFRYTDAQIAGMTEANLKVWTRPAGEPCSDWVLVGSSSLNLATNQITATGLTLLGQFTIAEDPPSPTAVQGISFTTQPNQQPATWVFVLMALVAVTGTISKYGFRYLAASSAEKV